MLPLNSTILLRSGYTRRLMDNVIVREALRQAAKFGTIVAPHCLHRATKLSLNQCAKIWKNRLDLSLLK